MLTDEHQDHEFYMVHAEHVDTPDFRFAALDDAMSLAEELANGNRGHEITVLVPLAEITVPKGYGFPPNPKNQTTEDLIEDVSDAGLKAAAARMLLMKGLIRHALPLLEQQAAAASDDHDAVKSFHTQTLVSAAKRVIGDRDSCANN